MTQKKQGREKSGKVGGGDRHKENIYTPGLALKAPFSYQISEHSQFCPIKFQSDPLCVQI